MNAYRAMVVKEAQSCAVERATAHLSVGPQHDVVTRQVMLQVQHLFDQVFEALRFSLAVASQRGFWAVLALGVMMLLMTFFLKDLPMGMSTSTDGEHKATVQEQETPAIL